MNLSHILFLKWKLKARHAREKKMLTVPSREKTTVRPTEMDTSCSSRTPSYGMPPMESRKQQFAELK